MKNIFVSGPYSGENSWEVERKVRMCEESALTVARLGGSPVCLNVLGRFFNGTLPYESWIEIAKDQIGRSDAIYMSTGWQSSSGSLREADFARTSGKPVLSTLEELRAFLSEP